MSTSRVTTHLGLYLLVLLGVIVIGFLDHVTGSELSFSIFYLAPVGLAVLYRSEGAAVLVSLVSAFVWWLVESQAHVYSHPAIGFWNAAVRLGFFLAVAVMLARLRRQADRDRDLASTDVLTGLPNRRAFLEAMTRETGRTRRSGRPMTLAYVDLDEFKAVNDEQGHAEGDRLLRSLGQAMQRSVRTGDLVARLGGDEFAVLLPETDVEAAQALLQRLHHTLLDAALGDAPVGLSIGAVTTSSPPSAERLMAEADALLYRVKRDGKNAIRVERSTAR